MRFIQIPSVLHEGGIHSLDIDNDNTKLITGGKDNTIKVWHTTILTRITKVKPGDDPDNIIKELNPLATIKSHNHLINSLKWFTTDSSSFISSDIEGFIYIHNIKDDTHVQIYPQPQTNAKSVVDCPFQRMID